MQHATPRREISLVSLAKSSELRMQMTDGVAALLALLEAAFKNAHRGVRDALVFQGSWETDMLVRSLAALNDVPNAAFIEAHADALEQPESDLGVTVGDNLLFGRRTQSSRVGRVLEDGISQITETTYNAQGSPLTTTDPLGRQTTSTYAADGVTRTSVRQTTGGLNDVLATYANFTALDQPQTVTDVAGETTTMTYNAAGQALTVTNALGQTTTSTYDAEGRLQSLAGPVSGTTTTYTYDAYGRPRTVTGPDGDIVTTDYDLFDRPVRVTYPDGSYEATTYDRLDVSTRRDRAGRITRHTYDPLRRLAATRDPAGRVVTQVWCTCGSLDALVDANGNRTSWERDVLGRVTRELRADGVTDTLYTYGARTGRLLTVTDLTDQVTTHSYAADDQRLSMTFTNPQSPPRRSASPTMRRTAGWRP
jgi:YD repeat-containing protein